MIVLVVVAHVVIVVIRKVIMGNHYNKKIWSRATLRIESKDYENVRQIAATRNLTCEKNNTWSASEVMRIAVKQYLNRNGIK